MKKPVKSRSIAAPPNTGPHLSSKPKHSRRKHERPAEIIGAAIELFIERGFGATRLEDVAQRAGVAKGTLYLYYASKSDLFRAIARSVIKANVYALTTERNHVYVPVTTLVPVLLGRAVHALANGRSGSILRLIIAESRVFPEIAQIWHDEVASKLLGVLAANLKEAQRKGEIRPGDPALFAISIIGPMLAAALFREVFGKATAALPDLEALASQHAEVVLNGILKPMKQPPRQRRK